MTITLREDEIYSWEYIALNLAITTKKKIILTTRHTEGGDAPGTEQRQQLQTWIKEHNEQVDSL